MDFDRYLGSADALRQTVSACGSVLQPGQLLDGMRVVAFLGRGATSEVWRVHDLRQDRDYALKILAPTPDTPAQARRRFLTEARALDEFRHPNLMRRYRLQETGEHPYFTMDVLRPLPEHLPERDILHLPATNAIDRQFQKMFLTRCKRRPIRIQGEGTLKCPDVTFCEVHLGPGVKFITSGRCRPDGNTIRDPIPPPDADWDNHIGYPAYVVEPGAKLIFTENDAYPNALVRHADSSL